MKDSEINSLFDIRGKTFVLAGAGGTVGMKLCSLLARAGADIAAIDINPQIKKIEGLDFPENRQVCSYICNLADPGDVEKTAEDLVADFGRVDVLINLACTFGSGKSLLELDYNEWKKDIEINLHTMFLSSTKFGKYMVEKRSGCIINFASTASYFYVQGSPKASYCAAKSGVVMLTKSLAYEWAESGVRVNAVAPGFIDIRENVSFDEQKEYSPREKERIEKVPLGRLARVEDLLGPIIMLSSRAAEYITGEVIMIDGGHSLSI